MVRVACVGMIPGVLVEEVEVEVLVVPVLLFISL